MFIYYICDACHMPLKKKKHGAPNRNDKLPEIIAKIWHGIYLFEEIKKQLYMWFKLLFNYGINTGLTVMNINLK